MTEPTQIVAAKNLDRTHRATDGRLVASSYSGGGCGDPTCPGFHLDLEDQDGAVFATMVIGPDQCEFLALELLEHAKEVRARHPGCEHKH